MSDRATSNSHPILALIDGLSPRFHQLSDDIWDTPELCFQEHRSAATQIAALREQGFAVTEGLGDIETAFMAEIGDQGPVISIIGEFDALAGLSQVAGLAERRELTPGGAGHGCGHNMLGAASILAAAALKDWMASNGIAARIRYYGCPAEEGGAAKTFLVRDGLFADVDAAISWHPFPFTEVNQNAALANTQLVFHFKGRAAHAAVAPELGRSALDAVELMNVGANYLREHMPPGARVHYAITDAGGSAPNVVQAKASVAYSVRAMDLAEMHQMVARVTKVAEGAALMTETTMTVEFDCAMSNLLPNRPLEQAMQAQIEALGPVPFDAADRAFAEAIRATLVDGAIASAYRRVGKPFRADEPLATDVLTIDHPRAAMFGSTDMGDVSWACPTVQVNCASYAIGTPGHSWQLVAQGKTPAGHKAVSHAARIMAMTGAAIIAEPALLARAKADHAERLAASPYVCPIPAEAQLPLRKSSPN